MKEFNSTSVFNNRGFTLLEILIAISILAFISVGVVTITENAFNTKDRTTEINKNNLQIETAMSRFEWDFSQIYSPLYFSTSMNLSFASGNNDMNGDGRDDMTGQPVQNIQQVTPELQNYYQQLMTRFEQNQHFSGISKEGLPIPRFYFPEKNIFEFFTSSNRRKVENARQSFFAWVRYTLAEPVARPDTGVEKNAAIPSGLKSLVRYYTADDPYDDKRIDPNSSSTTIKAAVLLENVESLEFQFWDYQRKRWETSLRNIQQGEGLIRGVKVIVAWYDSSGLKRTQTRIFRNHWPMVVPQEVMAQPGMNNSTGGTNGGNNQGGGNTGSTNGN
mgnify:CR=1 FL=1